MQNYRSYRGNPRIGINKMILYVKGEGVYFVDKIVTEMDLRIFLKSFSKSCKYIIERNELKFEVWVPTREVKKIRRRLSQLCHIGIYYTVYSLKNKRISKESIRV